VGQTPSTALFFPSFLFLARSEASWLTACRQDLQLVVPAHVKQVGHILMYEQEEFVELFDCAAAATARLCWRVAEKLAPPGPVAVAEKPTGMNVVLTASPSIGNVTGQTINVPVTVNVMPTEAKANAQNAPTERKEGAGRRQLGQEQRALTAIFGKPPEFGGKTDLEVLDMVKWAPIGSGGHTESSACSNFRNAFIAKFIRDNPSLAFNDKKTEEKVKKKSYDAYKAHKSAVDDDPPAEDPFAGRSSNKRGRLLDNESGTLGKNGEFDADQLGDFDYEGFDYHDRNFASAPAESGSNRRAVAEGASDGNQKMKKAASAAEAKGSHSSPVERSEEEMQPVEALQGPAATTNQEKLVPGKIAAESAAEVAAVVGQTKKRDRPGSNEKDEEDEAEEDNGKVDLVREAVNPNGTRYTVKMLKVWACRFFVIL
jgi:hypothetical protein